jgi:hypothetical protein
LQRKHTGPVTKVSPLSLAPVIIFRCAGHDKRNKALICTAVTTQNTTANSTVNPYPANVKKW